MRKVFFISLILIFAVSAQAQHIRDIKIDASYNGIPLSELLNDLKAQYPVDFVYNPNDLKPYTVTGIDKVYWLSEYLERFLSGFNIVRVQENILFIVKREEAKDYGYIKTNYLLVKPAIGKNETRIEGIVTDGGNDEPIPGAEVYLPQSGNGMLTDLDGSFRLKAKHSIQQLKITFTGYAPATFLIGFSELAEARDLKISLFQKSTELEGVVITAERADENISEKITGVETMQIESIRNLPTFLGEIDPIKSLATLPGVSLVGELSAGFNVRGGDIGQNLILQDGAVIYNPTHLFGFFSAFNPDMVNDVVLYKGGGSAAYGGRIASVLKVGLRNGDVSKLKVSGGIGLISSRLTLEGPIVRNKTSFLVGGRFSYSDWILHATNDIRLKNSSANFNDITAKVVHHINNNNFVVLSAYRSYDDFKLLGDSTFSWGTTNLSMRWDHSFSDKTVAVLQMASSNYSSQVNNQSQIAPSRYDNGINNLNLKYSLIHNQSESTRNEFGIEVGASRLRPGKLSAIGESSNVEDIELNTQQTMETAVYWQSDYDLNDQVGLGLGLRYAHFFRFGKDDIYSFDYNQVSGRSPAVIDTVSYSSGQLIDHYGGLEPRISIRYLIDGTSSLKFGYYRMYQYLHLISNTTSATPQDYWIASGPNVKPEIGDQFSLGYFRNFRNDQFEFSVEAFYKKISNAIDYAEGANVSLNPLLEGQLATGKGLAYGVEILAKKNTGRLNGWISYTYSRSLRQFDSEIAIQRINEGEYYPSIHDQPNNLSVIVNYLLGPRVTLSTNFSYSTGRPITIPISKYSYEGILSARNYSKRNEYRIPDYHRLDVSLTIKDKQQSNKRYMGEWVFSVYNLYGRKNAYTIYFSKYGTAKKLSVLGTVFPSLSYNFNF